MVRFELLILALLASLASTAWGYGGGGGSATCAEPKFFNPSPGSDSSVESLSEFKFTASDAEAGSVQVKVNGTQIPIEISPMANGDLSVSARVTPPITAPGRVQIAIDARSSEGCSGFQAYYIVVR